MEILGMKTSVQNLSAAYVRAARGGPTIRAAVDPLYSPSMMKPRRLHWPTILNLAWPAIFTRETSDASGVLRRLWNTGSSASTKGLFPTKLHPLAASKSLAPDERAPSTGWMTIWRLNICSWAVSIGEAVRNPGDSLTNRRWGSTDARSQGSTSASTESSSLTRTASPQGCLACCSPSDTMSCFLFYAHPSVRVVQYV